jgi:hypothetical protein
MALARCPECGREVSTRAEFCPHCGCPLDSRTLEECFSTGAGVSVNLVFPGVWVLATIEFGVYWDGRLLVLE